MKGAMEALTISSPSSRDMDSGFLAAKETDLLKLSRNSVCDFQIKIVQTIEICKKNHFIGTLNIFIVSRTYKYTLSFQPSGLNVNSAAQ